MDRTETPARAACDKDAVCVMKGRDAQAKQLTFTEQPEGARCSDGNWEAGACSSQQASAPQGIS